MTGFTRADPAPTVELLAELDLDTIVELLGADAEAPGSVLTLKGDEVAASGERTAGNPYTVTELAAVPDRSVDGVIGYEPVTGVAIRPLVLDLARVLRVGGWIRLAQSDPARAVVAPPMRGLTVGEAREIYAALLSPLPLHRGPVADELIWECRRAGLRPSHLTLGFGRRPVTPGEMDLYPRGAPAPGWPSPLDRILRVGGMALADRYVEVWEAGLEAGPVTVWTPVVVVVAQRVEDPPAEPVSGTVRRPSTTATISSTRPEAEWAILTALAQHRTHWDALFTGRRAAALPDRQQSAS